jgi:hypothetical protein
MTYVCRKKSRKYKRSPFKNKTIMKTEADSSLWIDYDKINRILETESKEALGYSRRQKFKVLSYLYSEKKKKEICLHQQLPRSNHLRSWRNSSLLCKLFQEYFFFFYNHIFNAKSSYSSNRNYQSWIYEFCFRQIRGLEHLARTWWFECSHLQSKVELDWRWHNQTGTKFLSQWPPSPAIEWN